MTRRTASLAFALFASLAAPAHAEGPRLTDLAPIPLRSGINRIPALTPDGRAGMIVLAWRDNGNAHCYDVALVMTEAEGGGPRNIVRREARVPSDLRSLSA